MNIVIIQCKAIADCFAEDTLNQRLDKLWDAPTSEWLQLTNKYDVRDDDVQSHNLNFATFAGTLIIGCLWSSETVLDFDIWWRKDWDIQGQRQHIIFALAKVA